MGVTEVFKNRKTGRKVIYKDVCKFESIEEKESTEYGITFTEKIEDIRTCILCENFDTHELYAIPILNFMTYYEPCIGITESVIDVFENLKNVENERNTENICALHSGESETDSEGSVE